MIYESKIRWQNRVDKNGLTVSKHPYEASCCMCNRMRAMSFLHKVDRFYICDFCAPTKEDAEELYVTVISLELL